MQNQLGNIVQLLRRYEFISEANRADWLRNQAESAPAATANLLDTDDWWGDSDSIAAIDLALAGGFTREARDDALAFRMALQKLYAEMQSHGVSSPQAEVIVAQFRKWQASHV